jgi:hypothetical protein
MGWEKRKRGGRYYTRSRKIGGRVVREYVGTGPIAEIAAQTDARERAYCKAEAEAKREERKRLGTADDAVTELCEAVDNLTRATLLAAGYHQHHRGEWRRRRRGKQAEEARQER